MDRVEPPGIGRCHAVTLSPAGPEWIDGSAMYGVLLLVLASVWRYGVELQQDRDLTV